MQDNNTQKSCFVIIPFSSTRENHSSEYWTKFFNIIKEIIEEMGYVCRRSEDGPYKLFDQIVMQLKTSDIVIAVLTDLNPNVWYELGIRHTLRQGTIMLMQKGQELPFDIRDYGVIFYEDSINLRDQLKNRISVYLNKMKKTDLSDSPVKNALNDKSGLANAIEKKTIIDLDKTKSRYYRILWVDDYPENNWQIINQYTNKGIKIDLAHTTEQALKLYKINLYDLILTDMGREMDEKAGLTLLENLKDLCCETPVVVYTTRKKISLYGKQAYRLGAHTVTNGIKDINAFLAEFYGFKEETIGYNF